MSVLISWIIRWLTDAYYKLKMHTVHEIFTHHVVEVSVVGQQTKNEPILWLERVRRRSFDNLTHRLQRVTARISGISNGPAFITARY